MGKLARDNSGALTDRATANALAHESVIGLLLKSSVVGTVRVEPSDARSFMRLTQFRLVRPKNGMGRDGTGSSLSAFCGDACRQAYISSHHSTHPTLACLLVRLVCDRVAGDETGYAGVGLNAIALMGRGGMGLANALSAGWRCGPESWRLIELN